MSLALVNERQAVAVLDLLPEDARAELTRVISAATAEALAMAQANEPSRTGGLRESTTAKMWDSATSIYGKVFIAREYGKAGALEYGSHRSVSVRAHEQMISLTTGSPVHAFIGPYSRTTNIQARSFMRDAATSIRGRVIDQITQAIATATERAASAG
jgi:hypothetical protein